MIENPSNLTQQLLNLVERVAVEIRAIYNKLKTAVFKVNGQTPDSDGNIQIDAVTKATQDGEGNVISNTYVKKTDKVTSASSADSATKATQDASGNVITSTYATKTEVNAKAPTSHASTATTYGIGTGSNYGHVKLSDSTSSTSTSSSGVAASPKAVKAAYDLANTANTAAATAITNANNALTAANSAVKKVNGTAPGSDGNVDVTLTKDKVTSALGYTPLQTAPVTSVDGKTGAVSLSNVYQPKGNYLTSAPVTSVMGMTGAVTGLVKSVNGTTADASGNVTLAVSDGTLSQKYYNALVRAYASGNTITVSNLTANKPVYIIVKALMGSGGTCYLPIVTSGAVLNAEDKAYAISKGSVDSCCTIASATSMSIMFKSNSTSSDKNADYTVYVYQ